jgi:hypothetical protein
VSATSSRSDVTRTTRGLTANEARLVEVIATAAEQGKTLSRLDAGELAGYGKGETARVQASRALAREPVRKALLDRARDVIAMDALHAAAMIRHVRQTGSRGQQLTASVETLKLTGMGASEAPAGGTIAVQVVLPGNLGTLLTQSAAHQPQALAQARVVEGEHSLVEAEGGPRRGRDPSPRPKRQAPAKAPGGRKPRAKAVTRDRRTISASPEAVSGDETRDE